MAKRSEPVISCPSNTADRASVLVDAFLQQMAVAGLPGATARTVAARAGVSASSINYHFDSIERLYGIAQADAAARAVRWLQDRIDDCAPAVPLPAAAFSAFAADVIDRWTHERVLAQAEAAAFLQAAWGPADASAAWLSVWEDFWARALPCFSLPVDAVRLVSAVLHSERLGHLVRWRAPFDRAGLEEVCVRLTARLTRAPALLALDSPWRDAAEALSRRTVEFPTLAPAAARIAEGVVAAVDEGGEAALTHRAVAFRAGVSLGAVTHHFPTRTALAEAGYASLYESLVQSARKAGAGQARHGDIGAHIVSFLNIGRTAPHSRALESFFLSATRDPALADFAARVRYSRGLSTWSFLRHQAPRLTRLDGLIISHWIAGTGRAITAVPERARDLEAGARQVANLFE